MRRTAKARRIVWGTAGSVCCARGTHSFTARAGHHLPPQVKSSIRATGRGRSSGSESHLRPATIARVVSELYGAPKPVTKRHKKIVVHRPARSAVYESRAHCDS